jgi:hypothetical protein
MYDVILRKNPSYLGVEGNKEVIGVVHVDG